MSIKELERPPFIEYTISVLSTKQYTVIDLTEEGAMEWLRNKLKRDDTITPIHFVVMDRKEFEQDD